MLLRFSQFSPLYPPLYPHPLPSSIPPPLSSCPCLVHISSLRSVSYTISMPPTLFMPNFILLLPCTFAPLFLPSPSPLKFLHVKSISLILFLFQLFAQFWFSFFFLFFLVQLLIVVSLLSFHCSQFWIFFNFFISPFNISYNKGLVM